MKKRFRNREPEVGYRHEGHARPITRRDFLAQGLIAGAAAITLPSLSGLLRGSGVAQAQTVIDCGVGAGAGKIPFLCFNDHCSTRKKVFYITSDKVPPTVMAGAEAMLCPKCGKKQAVVAVPCPHCMQWNPQTLENCKHCHRPLRSMGPKPTAPSGKPAPKTP